MKSANARPASPTPQIARLPQVGRLPRLRRVAIYAIGIGVWLTGCLWIGFHYFVRVTDDFGMQSNSPLEQTWLAIHAAFSFLAIWMFGVLWLGHIKVGWFARSKRATGGTLFTTVAILIATGWGLYYGHAGLREWLSLLHWILGVAALLVFLWHVPLRFSGRTPRSGDGGA